MPNQPTEVKYELPDVLHTLPAKGHRLLVQVQSTWFPLVDRNPQTFVPMDHATAEAKAKDVSEGQPSRCTTTPAGDSARPSAVRP